MLFLRGLPYCYVKTATWCNFCSFHTRKSSLVLFPIIQHVRPIFHSNKFFLRRKKEPLIIVAFHRLARKTLYDASALCFGLSVYAFFIFSCIIVSISSTTCSIGWSALIRTIRSGNLVINSSYPSRTRV